METEVWHNLRACTYFWFVYLKGELLLPLRFHLFTLFDRESFAVIIFSFKAIALRQQNISGTMHQLTKQNQHDGKKQSQVKRLIYSIIGGFKGRWRTLQCSGCLWWWAGLHGGEWVVRGAWSSNLSWVTVWSSYTYGNGNPHPNGRKKQQKVLFKLLDISKLFV